MTDLDEPQLSGADIICIGSAEWDSELRTNQHHVMSRLARSNRILFVESLGLRRPQFAISDARRLWRRFKRGLRGIRVEGDVHVLSPLVLPVNSLRITRAINRALLRRQVDKAVARVGLIRPVLWGYVPQADGLIESVDPSLTIYHCVDDLAAQKGVHASSFREAERRFAARADIVLASASSLSARMRQISSHVVDAPNVADVDFFAGALEDGHVDSALALLKAPRIVFTGAIVATKVDFEWLVALARLRPSWNFALIGPVGYGDPRTDTSRLRRVSNIHFMGSRPYEVLPSVLRGADAAVIPYALNALTASIFPMKLYEYLAAGLPVVATPLPTLRGVAGVTIARDVHEASSQLERLMAEDTPERRRARSSAAGGHSWGDLLSEIARAVHAASPRGAPAWMANDLVEAPQD